MQIERLKRWIPAILMMAAIFFFSSLPSAEIPNFNAWDWLVKKGGHALGYGFLAAAYTHGLGRKKVGWLPWILAVGYALSDELHQRFVPGRNGSLLDVGIDSIGAGLGLWAWTSLTAYWQRKMGNSS